MSEYQTWAFRKRDVRTLCWEADASKAWELKTDAAWLLNRAQRCGVSAIIADGWGQFSEPSKSWQNPEAQRDAITCHMCGKGVVALLLHESCGHAACAKCWADSLPGDGWPTLDTACRNCRGGCSLCRANDSPLAAFPGDCGHAACQPCLRRHLAAEVAVCRAEARDIIHCVVPGCPCFLKSRMHSWPRLCRLSPEVQVLGGELLAMHRRLRDLPTQESPVGQAGPVCVICREHRWALVVNSSCGHGACEACWTAWAEAQVPSCQARKRDVARCFAHSCGERVEDHLWSFLADGSASVGEFFRSPMAARRRRLRQSELFPAAMQVDCPLDCWGLGYLGFDTVMCFVCEHQWSPEEAGNAPAEVSEEDFMGLKVKRCPRCQEAIQKSGGCDHMTCRCSYEFWWTSLQPYRKT